MQEVKTSLSFYFLRVLFLSEMVEDKSEQQKTNKRQCNIDDLQFCFVLQADALVQQSNFNRFCPELYQLFLVSEVMDGID